LFFISDSTVLSSSEFIIKSKISFCEDCLKKKDPILLRRVNEFFFSSFKIEYKFQSFFWSKCLVELNLFDALSK